MAKRMVMNAFTQCCSNHHSEGMWKHPLDGSAAVTAPPRTGSSWPSCWNAAFDALFLADVTAPIACTAVRAIPR